MFTPIGNFVYRFVTASLKMPVFALLKEFENAEKMTQEELIEYQWNKLGALIKYAVSHSKYYKEIFSDLGAEPEDIKDMVSFKKIPVLTKSIVRERGHDILVNPKSLFTTNVKTSGSTGQPLKFYKDPIGKASTYAAMYRCHRWYGVDIGAREARLWGMPSTLLDRGKVKCADFMLNRIRQANSQECDSTFGNFYYKMRKFRPEYLMGYPSLIYSFARFCQNAGLNGKNFNLKFVKCTAEVIFHYQKELIEKVFGCPCISEYGAAETGVISFECPARNHHIMADSVFVEYGVNNLSLKDEPQALIVTNLHNRSFPIIRYDIGDLVYFQEGSCSCGRSFPLISKVKGRIHDIVIGNNGKIFHSSIFAYILKNVIKRGFNFKQIKFVQDTIGKVQVHIVPSVIIDGNRSDALKKLIQRAFNDDVYIEIKFFPDFQRDPSGKFRYFISKLNYEDSPDRSL